MSCKTPRAMRAEVQSYFAKRLQSPLTPYMPSAEKQATINSNLLCFINTSESPYRRPIWLVATNTFSAKALKVFWLFVWASPMWAAKRVKQPLEQGSHCVTAHGSAFGRTLFHMLWADQVWAKQIVEQPLEQSSHFATAHNFLGTARNEWSGVPPRKPGSPPLRAAPRTAASSIAAPSLLAAPQVLHHSSPHHPASTGQARARAKLAAMEAAAAAVAAAVRKTALAVVGRAAVVKKKNGGGWFEAGGVVVIVAASEQDY
eukprot:1152617-Pelagomonas_calceolata.AAC.5